MAAYPGPGAISLWGSVTLPCFCIILCKQLWNEPVPSKARLHIHLVPLFAKLLHVLGTEFISLAGRV